MPAATATKPARKIKVQPIVAPPTPAQVVKAIAPYITAWDRVGTAFTDPKSATQAIQDAGLDYVFESAPLVPVTLKDGSTVAIKNRVAVVRQAKGTSPAIVVGLVHPNYPILQPLDEAAVLDPVTKTWPVVAAGEVDKGAGTFMVMDAGESKIKGHVLHEYYLVYDYRDGRHAMQTVFAPVWGPYRTILMTGMRSASMRISIPHTHGRFQADAKFYINFMARVRSARDAVVDKLRKLGDTSITSAQTDRVLATAYPTPSKPKALVVTQAVDEDGLTPSNDPAEAAEMTERLKIAQERWDYYRNRVLAMRASCLEVLLQITTEFPDLAGTALALYIAVAKYEDHRRGSRSAAESTVFGLRARTKEIAFQTILSETGV